MTVELLDSGRTASGDRLSGCVAGVIPWLDELVLSLRPITTTDEDRGVCSLGDGALACGTVGLTTEGSLIRSVPRTINGAVVLPRSELRPELAAEFSADPARVVGLAAGLDEGMSMVLARGEVVVVTAGDSWAATESRVCGAVVAGRETGFSTARLVRPLAGDRSGPWVGRVVMARCSRFPCSRLPPGWRVWVMAERVPALPRLWRVPPLAPVDGVIGFCGACGR